MSDFGEEKPDVAEVAAVEEVAVEVEAPKGKMSVFLALFNRADGPPGLSRTPSRTCSRRP